MIVDQRSRSSRPPGPRPDISVVLCSHNGEDTIAQALSHLQRQSLSPDRYELIVVDDGSVDRTAEIAALHGARVIKLWPNRGLGAARNAGTAAARAPIIAFTDDDCRPAEDWLEKLTDALRDPSVEGASGRVVPACTDKFMLRYLSARNPLTPLGADLLASSRRAYRLRRYLRQVIADGGDLPAGAPLYSLVGANMAIRRELILELGGFDEAIRFGGEEEELCRRAHGTEQGALLVYEPGAVVVHRFEAGPRDALRRARAYGRAHPHSVRKHRDLQLIVYPFPAFLAVAMLLAILTRSSRQILLVALAPLAAYGRWPREAWRSRSLMPLAFPYLELAEEASTMVGEVEGLCAGS